MAENKEEMLAVLRDKLAWLSDHVPQQIDLYDPPTKYKLTGKVKMLRASLIWRAEELGRNALAAFNEQNFVTAALITRALLETTGALVYLHTLVQKAVDEGVTESLDGKMTGFLTGSKIWEDIGGAVHVNDMLREVQKVIPGYFDEHYGMLSEFAHPNWSGTFGAYAIIDKEKLLVDFARGGRSPDTQFGIILGRLSGTIGLFVGYYQMFDGMIEPFAQAVEAFYVAKNAEVTGES